MQEMHGLRHKKLTGTQGARRGGSKQTGFRNMVFSPTEARKIMLGHLKREVLMVLNPTELTPEGLQPLLQALKGPVVVTRRQLQVMPAWVAVMVLTPQW